MVIFGAGTSPTILRSTFPCPQYQSFGIWVEVGSAFPKTKPKEKVRCQVEEFTQILRRATAAVPAEFFLLPVHESEAVLRERVYCYELYHQLRCLWPRDCVYRLNGEVRQTVASLLSWRG
jgi:hypothetical protein